ncbi:CACNA1S [Symbiodinium sp. CCMP2592]|nr:CACNA1S [Symbiodinium sp. CCMP2592]
MHGRRVRGPKCLSLVLPWLVTVLARQTLEAADELVDEPRHLVLRDEAGQPLANTGTEDPLVCEDTEDGNRRVPCFDFSTVKCKAFTPQQCNCDAVLPICLTSSGRSSLASAIRNVMYTCCARPGHPLEYGMNESVTLTTTAPPSNRHLWQANPNSKCFGKGKSTIGDFTLQECKSRCEDDVLRPEDPRTTNGTSLKAAGKQFEVCDSIRFQPHTFNASAFEHTGTCSFIYETDVESCEPASGTLTFFRVNDGSSSDTSSSSSSRQEERSHKNGESEGRQSSERSSSGTPSLITPTVSSATTLPHERTQGRAPAHEVPPFHAAVGHVMDLLQTTLASQGELPKVASVKAEDPASAQGDELQRIPSLQTLLKLQDGDLDDLLGRPRRPSDEDPGGEESEGIFSSPHKKRSSGPSHFRDRHGRVRHNWNAVRIETLSLGMRHLDQRNDKTKPESELEKSWGDIAGKLAFVLTRLDQVVPMSASSLLNEALQPFDTERRMSVNTKRKMEGMAQSRIDVRGMLQALSRSDPMKSLKDSANVAILTRLEEFAACEKDIVVRERHVDTPEMVQLGLQRWSVQQGFCLSNIAERRELARALCVARRSNTRRGRRRLNNATARRKAMEDMMTSKMSHMTQMSHAQSNAQDEDGNPRAKDKEVLRDLTTERGVLLEIKREMTKLKRKRRVLEDQWVDQPRILLTRLENQSRSLRLKVEAKMHELEVGRQRLADANRRWQSNRTLTEPTLVDLEIQATHAAPDGGYIQSFGGYALAAGATVQVDRCIAKAQRFHASLIFAPWGGALQVTEHYLLLTLVAGLLSPLWWLEFFGFSEGVTVALTDNQQASFDYGVCGTSEESQKAHVRALCTEGVAQGPSCSAARSSGKGVRDFGGPSQQKCIAVVGEKPISGQNDAEGPGMVVHTVRQNGEARCELLPTMWCGLEGCAKAGAELLDLQSPRSRGKGDKGRGKQDGKQPKGKPGGKAVPWPSDAPPTAPSVEDLPVAPVTPTIVPPRKPTPDATASNDRLQLEALAKILSTSGINLPDAAQQLVVGIQQSSSQSSARALHKAVADQTRAKQSLAKVRQARLGYTQAWATYLGQLTQVVETQVREQERILDELDDAEAQWSGAEREATQLLAKMTSSGDGKPEDRVTEVDDEDKDMDAAEAAVDAAIDMEAKMRAETEARRQASQNVVAVLGQLRQSAQEQAGTHEREGSRTPRRGSGTEPKDETKEVTEIKEPQQEQSLPPGRQAMCGPTQLFGAVLSHSIAGEWHYVGPYMSQVLGAMQQLVCSLDRLPLDIQHTVWEDPRIADVVYPAPPQYDAMTLETVTLCQRLRQDPGSVFGLSIPAAPSTATGTERCDRLPQRPPMHMYKLGVGSGVCGSTSSDAVAEAGATAVDSLTVSRMDRRHQNAMYKDVNSTEVGCGLGPEHRRFPQRTVSFAETPDIRLFFPGSRLQARQAHCEAGHSYILDAQSQLVQPRVVSTARPSLPRGVPPAESTPARSTVTGYSAVRMGMAARVGVSPDFLDRPELRNLPLTQFSWFCGHRASGADTDGSQRNRYAAFSTAHHLTLRRLPLGSTLNDVIADLIGEHPRLRAIRVMQHRLEALPSLQVVALTRTDEPHLHVLPFDLRGVQGRVCTLGVPRQLAHDPLAAFCLQSCPQDRLPREPFQLFDPADLPANPAAELEQPDFYRGRPYQLPVEPAPGDDLHEAETDGSGLLQIDSWATLTGPAAKNFDEDEIGDAPLGRQDTAPLACPGEPPQVQVPQVYVADPTDLQLIRAEDLHILPPEFRDEEAFTSPISRFKWGRAHRDLFGLFTVFDTRRHAVIIQGVANSNLHTLVAQAVANAPFQVSAVHVLTCPLSGLPKPQLVLHEAGRPLPFMPVPWDLRQTDGLIRTVEHRQGQGILEALQAVYDTIGGLPTLMQRFEDRSVAVHDALGAVLHKLPDNLLKAQFFETIAMPRGSFASQRIQAPILTGGSLQQEGTTRTATWMQAVSVAPALPILRLIIFRGSIAASADLNPPFHTIDHVLAQLLTQISAMLPLADHSALVLAAAQPPPLGYVQEVVFLISDSRTSVPCLWDARPVGGGLQLLSQDLSAPTASVLAPSWRSEGWSVAVNGVPVQHMSRDVVFGDFFQPYHGESPYPTTPLGFILRACPALEAFAIPLWIRKGGLPMTTYDTLFPRLTEVLRRRRDDMGHFHLEGGLAVIHGPTHGTVHLHFAGPTSPGVHEVADQMVRLDWQPGWEAVVRTAALWPETALFVTSAPGVVGNTVLLPAPHHPEQHFVLLVPQRPGLLSGLPGESVAQLMPRRSMGSGDVLYFQRDPGRAMEPDSEQEGEAAALLQLSASRAHVVEGCNSLAQGPSTRDKSKPIAIPTPGGRRFIKPVVDSQPGPTAGGPKQLVLQEVLPPEAPSIAWSVCSDIAQECLRQHQLSNLRHDLDYLSSEYRPFTAAWALLPPWDRRQVCEELLIYTDGSFFPGNPRATWSVIVLGRIGACFVRVGFFADWVEIASSEVPSAYDGEIEALLHAMALTGNSDTTQVHILCDCASALLVAEGTGGIDLENPACRALAGLAFFARAKGKRVTLTKVPAHSGDAFNDMADLVAKQVGRGKGASPWRVPFDDFRAAAAERVLERLWLTCADCTMRMGLPLLTQTGTWAATAGAPATTKPPAVLVGLGTEELGTAPRRLKLRVLQYNVLSLRGDAAKTMLSAGAKKGHFDVACFQETRVQQSGFSTVEGWWVLSASSTSAGVGGVQIWINPHQSDLAWDRKELSILHASEQCLIVLGQANGIDLAVVAGHAPPSTSPPEVLQTWWSNLAAAVGRIPRKYCLITGLDANARFELDHQCPQTLTSAPLCENARHLLDFVCTTGGDLTSQCDCNGAPLVSWVSPNGQPALLDYITFPREWSGAAVTLPTPDLGDLHSGHDHWPVALELDVTCEGRSRQPIHRISPEQIRSAAGVTMVQHALATIPHIPWTVDSTTHVDIIHRHIHACLSSLPQAERKARNPALTQDTIDLVVYKRHVQRCLKTARQRSRRALLWILFKAWRGRPLDYQHSRQVIAQAQECEQRWFSRFKAAKQHLSQAMLKDKAEFARRCRLSYR